MYNIVGVGKGVKNLMESFDQYKEYKTFYIDEDILDSNGNALRIVGVYNDICVRSPSGWIYSERRFDPLYHGPGVLRTEHTLPYPADINSAHDA